MLTYTREIPNNLCIKCTVDKFICQSCFKARCTATNSASNRWHPILVAHIPVYWNLYTPLSESLCSIIGHWTCRYRPSESVGLLYFVLERLPEDGTPMLTYVRSLMLVMNCILLSALFVDVLAIRICNCMTDIKKFNLFYIWYGVLNRSCSQDELSIELYKIARPNTTYSSGHLFKVVFFFSGVYDVQHISGIIST